MANDEDSSTHEMARVAQNSEIKACASFEKQINLAGVFVEELEKSVDTAIGSGDKVKVLMASKKVDRIGYRIDKLETTLERLEADQTQDIPPSWIEIVSMQVEMIRSNFEEL